MSTPEGNVVKLVPPSGIPRGPARPKRRAREDDEVWLVSYSDLLTLLFCFFSLMLSVSTVDVNRMDRAKTQISRQFGDGEVQGLAGLQRNIQKVVEEAGIASSVRIRQTARGLVVDLNAQILFEPGSADLDDQAKDVLDGLLVPLKDQPIRIQVEGHTDPLPIQNAKFASNWELSSARATGVVRYLVDVLEFPAEHLSALALADTVAVDEAGVPLVAPAKPEERTESYLARQRRVTLLLSPLSGENGAR